MGTFVPMRSAEEDCVEESTIVIDSYTLLAQRCTDLNIISAQILTPDSNLNTYVSFIIINVNLEYRGILVFLRSLKSGNSLRFSLNLYNYFILLVFG